MGIAVNIGYRQSKSVLGASPSQGGAGLGAKTMGVLQSYYKNLHPNNQRQRNEPLKAMKQRMRGLQRQQQPNLAGFRRGHSSEQEENLYFDKGKLASEIHLPLSVSLPSIALACQKHK